MFIVSQRKKKNGKCEIMFLTKEGEKNTQWLNLFVKYAVMSTKAMLHLQNALSAIPVPRTLKKSKAR